MKHRTTRLEQAEDRAGMNQTLRGPYPVIIIRAGHTSEEALADFGKHHPGVTFTEDYLPIVALPDNGRGDIDQMHIYPRTKR